MTELDPLQLLAAAQDLGGGRFGILVEHEGTTLYVEHQVGPHGLRAKVWDEDRDVCVAEQSMDWAELVRQLVTTPQADGRDTASV